MNNDQPHSKTVPVDEEAPSSTADPVEPEPPKKPDPPAEARKAAAEYREKPTAKNGARLMLFGVGALVLVGIAVVAWILSRKEKQLRAYVLEEIAKV